MMKYAVGLVCGLMVAGTVYFAAARGPAMAADAPPATAPATAKAAAVDVGNTKCIVTGEDVGHMGGAKTVEYKGKVYHTCCDDCVPAFNKEPEKYIKLLEADPKKFGVK